VGRHADVDDFAVPRARLRYSVPTSQLVSRHLLVDSPYWLIMAISVERPSDRPTARRIADTSLLGQWPPAPKGTLVQNGPS
jgi:hypothetical protein